MFAGRNEEEVEAHFAELGFPVKVPRDFDYRFLERADIVEFKGRRVAKLTFSSIDNDRTAIAYVLIISPRQFRTSNLPARNIAGATSVLFSARANFYL